MRRFRLTFGLVFVLAAALPASAQRSAPASEPKDTKAAFDVPHLHVELLVPGQDLFFQADNLNQAGLHFKLEPGWHIYWKNPGDSGAAPAFIGPCHRASSPALCNFLRPRRLPLGPLMDFGYENEVLFPFQFHVGNLIKPGPATLHAKVDWLVCREVCIPGKAELEVQRNVAQPPVGATAVATPFFKQFLAGLPNPLPPADHAVFQPTATGFRLAVETGQRETQAAFFPEDQDILDNPAPQKLTPTATGPDSRTQERREPDRRTCAVEGRH